MKFLLRVRKINVHIQIYVLHSDVSSIAICLIYVTILQLGMLEEVVVGLESGLIYNGTEVAIYCVISLYIEIVV